MSEQSTVVGDKARQSENSPESNKIPQLPEVSISDVLQEFQETPREYWPYLIQIIRIFRAGVTLKPIPPNPSPPTPTDEMTEAEILAKQHEALKELTRQWIEEGDEQEGSSVHSMLNF
ncbi:MAG: hypothetical protein SW833_24500 [Cyanobacteriota bacterium]|nr:hypothetical protein [Cyanobacteriota bacterium]